MPANVLFRRPWPLPQVVVVRSAFATARSPRVSRRVRVVPGAGDQWPRLAAPSHRASRLEFALLRTVSARERDVDRELQWTKAPSIEGLPRSNRRRHILYGMHSLHAVCAALGLIGSAVASTPPLDITEYAHTA